VGRMHGDDLPDLLGLVSIALTLVVIWYARGTIIEARKATTEEKNTVAELQSLLTAVGDLTATSRDTLKEARRTAELASQAQDRDQSAQLVAQLRQILRLTKEIEVAASQDPTGVEASWRCVEQLYLAAALDHYSSVELSECRKLVDIRGMAAVKAAAEAASFEVDSALRSRGVGPR
jgi:hypothetical protein